MLQPKSGSRQNKVVGLYYQNSSIYASQCFPSMLPLESVTHIFYAFATIAGTNPSDPELGTVKLTDPWADYEKPMDNGGLGCLGEFSRLRQTKFPHLRVLLSIGGYGNSSNFALLTNNEAFVRFIDSAARIVNQFGFDGIDLDWEYPETSEHRNLYVSLVRELRKTLGSNSDVTIASPAGEHNLQWIDLQRMDQYISFWNVMTYDFAGPWSEVTDHHSALYSKNFYSVSNVLESYLKYVSPEKLVMGIPLYGRSFANTRGIGHSFRGCLPGKIQEGVHDIKDLPLPGFKEKVDSKAGAATCSDGNNLVSYDNSSTIIQKADYARQNGLRGAMFWQASNDRPGADSLVRLFSREFLY